MHISKSIVTNIGEDVVKSFLRKNDITKYSMDNAQNLETLISESIDSKRLKGVEVKEFFYNELMFGKRNHVRVYNLDDYKNMIYTEDWVEVLKSDYEIETLEFNNIITTIPNQSEPEKIAAIHTEYNDKMEIKIISILFVYYIKVKDIGDSCSYLPVEFDFQNEIMTIKAWQRQGLDENEKYKSSKLMDKTIDYLKGRFNYTTHNKSLVEIYKKTLYNMNKGLVEELFDNIPSYKDAELIKDDISSFSDIILSKMQLQNKKYINGKFTYPKETMDIKDELLKLIQRLSVADYFMTHDYNETWDMKTTAIVNSVKFYANDNVVALVSGANKRSPVFCSNSFLSLLISMEQTKMVDKIWISFKSDKRKIVVNFDASNVNYFEFTKLNSRIYSREELENIWEVLMNYEPTANAQTDTVDRTSAS